MSSASANFTAGTDVDRGHVPPATRPKTLSPLDRISVNGEPGVFVLRTVIERLKNETDALLLSQVEYWFQPRKTERFTGRARAQRPHSSGRPCLITCYRELSEQTGLSTTQIKRSLARLKESGLLTTEFNYELGVRRLEIELTPAGCSVFQSEIKSPGVHVYAGVVRLAGSPSAALVLSQIAFWHAKGNDGTTRLQKHREGHYWLAKRHEELALELGMMQRSVRSAIDHLKERGILECRTWLFHGVRALHIRIVHDRFLEMWREQRDRSIMDDACAE